MANQGRQRFDLETLGLGRLGIFGSFAPNGSSAVDASSNQGDTGWSVAYTSTGLFTLTLEDKWLRLLSGWAHLQLASGDDKIAQLGTIDVASGRTVQIRVWDISAAAVANVSADANNRIHFGLMVKRLATYGRR